MRNLKALALMLWWLCPLRWVVVAWMRLVEHLEHQDWPLILFWLGQMAFVCTAGWVIAILDYGAVGMVLGFLLWVVGIAVMVPCLYFGARQLWRAALQEVDTQIEMREKRDAQGGALSTWKTEEHRDRGRHRVKRHKYKEGGA